MRRLTLCIVLICTITNCINAQIDRTRTWVFGDGIGIHFTNYGKIDTFSGILQSKDPNYEGTANYNDSTGNLMYYIFDGNLLDKYNTFYNTNNFISGGSSASQANIITSLNDSIFHIFGSTSGFDYYYSCFTKASGKFKVLGKSLIHRASESQAHVNHQNGRWQWVVCHSRLGDTLYSYLITDDGLETCPVISHAGPFYDDWYPGQGLIKFSPDGKYLFLSTWSAEKLVFCSFNDQTGEIKELFQLYEPYSYGIEIKENNLFLTCGRPNDRLYLYSIKDMDSALIVNSKKKLFDTTETDVINQIQLAPDGNLYVALWQQNRLGKISKVQNGSFQFTYTTSLFGTKKCYGGFPNFNASYFHTPALNFNYTRNCKTNTFHFTATDTFDANNWQWQYSKGNISYTGSGKQTNYTFPDTGVWQVRCIGSNGSRKDTVTKTIEILNPLPPSYLGEDILLPKSASINGIIGGPSNMHCTHWQRLDDTLEVKGRSYSYSDTGYFICKATNKVFCTYTDTIRVRVCDSFANAAIIERSGDSLFTKTYASKYQWYLNNTAINGATNKQLKINQTGNYALRTWNAAGCDSVSALLNVNQLGLKYVDFDKIKVYPNPNSGIFMVECKSAAIQSIIISDAIGRLAYEAYNIHSKNVEINTGLKSGIYLLKVNGILMWSGKTGHDEKMTKTPVITHQYETRT